MKVNLFKNVKSLTPSLTRDVNFFLDRIRNGNSKNIIDKIRKSEDKEESKFLKLSLPGVCFNGTFTKRYKKDLKKSSGLMILDFDDFESFTEAKDFKAKLKKDNHIYSTWFSPREGVKALYRIMNVKDDNEFKKVYSEAAKKYPNLDASGKDISRLCFESYDPDIYVNLDAEIFSPSLILEEEINNIGTVTNIPITDTDSVVNRLIIWFERDILNNSNLNTSIFILACAFNKFGVSKTTATEYGFRYAKSTAKDGEVNKIITSAYKKTAEWNTKFFEDVKTKRRLINMVSSGKSDKDIIKSFKEIPEENLNNEIKTSRKNITPEKFWEYDFHGEPKIKPFKFKTFLESKDFSKYYPDNGSNAFIFINKDDNFIDIISEYQIKDFVLQDLQHRFEIDIFDIVAEKTKLFTYQYLSILDTSKVDVVKDTKDFAMLYYQNVALKVEYNKITEIKYSDLEGYVWKSNVIAREYKDVDHHQSQFRSFLWLVSGQDKDRYNTFKSLMGYLLHSYKNSANNKAIILNDEKISDNPNGGSGKGLLTMAISKMKNVSVIDGKTFDFNKSFPYQTVSTDSQVLAFDDAKQNFKFEQLFSLITEGITLEYKGKDAIKLSVEDSPKIMISTNYTIKTEGGSFERRMFEVELSSYFNKNHTPLDEFGNMIFDGWDENQWNLFDKFMIKCIQYYLENGLVTYNHINLEIRKLINSTSQDFLDFMDEKSLFDGERLNYKELKNAFVSDFEDYRNHQWFNQKVFNKWLGLYLDFKDFSYESISSNGIRFYDIQAVSDEAKNMKDSEEDNNGIEF